MKQYFPTLSSDNVRRVDTLISDNPITTIIEFGSGNSTLYFLKKYKTKQLKFISIETSKVWYYKNIKTIKSLFPYATGALKKVFWNENDYSNFFEKPHEPYTPVHSGTSRLGRWKRSLELGPFFRFEPDSGLKGAGLLPRTLKPLLVYSNKLLRHFSHFKFERSSWVTMIGSIELNYELICPGMKDQFGESPNREAYVQSALNQLSASDSEILVMIDAGPRHFVLDELAKNIKDRTVHICLFDAQRPEYELILSKYNGLYYKGNEILMDGSNFYQKEFPDLGERNKALRKELWYCKLVL